MRIALLLAAALSVAGAANAQISSDQRWYSEEVSVAGKLFLPAGMSPTGATPGVVVAPGWGETEASVEAYASALAADGIAALTLDYRGFGKSGGLLYLGEQPVQAYDKMRFSEQTPQLVIRRGRLDPEQQVQDIRNAITFLQSQPGVDRARIGVLGPGVAGGHVVSVMGMDTRAKVGAAVMPVIAGQKDEEKSFIPDAKTQAEMIKLAREGAPPRTAAAMKARNDEEAKILLGEYKPFWRLKAIPEAATLGLLVPGNNKEMSADATAVAKATKAKAEVVSLAGGASTKLDAAGTQAAAKTAASWMKTRFDALKPKQ